ncbi:hypothetical protein AB205_0099850 [Aquarana catesbeiana]|uniref:Uncharacterized protein n=1 Tax=Aquarana catesbeiana TaxID=8400 RepID=A0A2G9R444_AQUCT|nr:hypothetical protein AB205_0099850 [Aquarana catesbeiana]
MCENCTKKVSIPALEREKNVFTLELCPKRQLCDNSKQCFRFLFLTSNICVLSIPFFIHIGEKRLRISEDTRDTLPPKDGEIPTPQPEDVEKGEVYEVGEIVSTTGDVDVVEEETHFTSASAHFLIGEIMVCNQDLQKIKEDINDVEKRLKNIIDVLGGI